MCVSASRGSKSPWSPRSICESRDWVLALELQSSSKIVCALNSWAISAPVARILIWWCVCGFFKKCVSSFLLVEFVSYILRECVLCILSIPPYPHTLLPLFLTGPFSTSCLSDLSYDPLSLTRATVCWSLMGSLLGIKLKTMTAPPPESILSWYFNREGEGVIDSWQT